MNLTHNFKNKKLLKDALTHSSYPGSKGGNERLEFLGDSVLSVVVSKRLFEELPEKTEGYLTKLRARLICESALYEYAKSIDLGEYLLLGKGEELSGGRQRKSLLADAFEAVIAAVYLDGGLEAATAFILPFLPDKAALKSGKLINGDYKTMLQEIVQRNPEDKISYQNVEQSGEAHNRTFTTNVLLNGNLMGSGSGASKKESEQAAARAALIRLGC